MVGRGFRIVILRIHLCVCCRFCRGRVLYRRLFRGVEDRRCPGELFKVSQSHQSMLQANTRFNRKQYLVDSVGAILE